MLMEKRQAEGKNPIAVLRRLTAGWDGASGNKASPSVRLAALRREGALAAFKDAAAIRDLGISLRLVGGADLSLGRLCEWHVTVIQLIEKYGALPRLTHRRRRRD